MKFDMRLARPVTGLTSDAEFANGALRMAGLAFEERARRGCMAANAIIIPDLHRVRLGWIAQECLVEWRPALVGIQPRKGKQQLSFAKAGRKPADLHVMRASEQACAQLDTRRRASKQLLWRSLPRAPQRIVHLGEESFRIVAEFVTRTGPFKFHAVEFSENSLRRRNLRHRAMITFEPGLMFARMTRRAGFRPHVTVATIAHRSVLRALERDFSFEILPFAQSDRARNRRRAQQQA